MVKYYYGGGKLCLNKYYIIEKAFFSFYRLL